MPRLRTGYSFRAAVGPLDEVMSRIKECGWPVAPITDRASTFGWVRWEKAAKAEGLRPVFGIELAVVESYEEKKPTFDFWTFLAIDNPAEINRLVSLATQQFRYQPLITYRQALEAPGLVKIVGHRCKIDALPEEIPSGLFYGLSPASMKGHVRRAISAGLTPIAVSDNVFPRKEDMGFYETLCGRGASSQTYDQHIQTDEEWLVSTARSGISEEDRRAALARRWEVLDGCQPTLRKADLVKPPRPATLRAMCEEGAEKLGCDLSDPTYAARLERELGLIDQKEFGDYFYLVADLCRWARKRMAVGPARGSSCGSLVCYLLEITTVDPIPHGLIFERFIDINREDLPDIDIDFSDQQRHLVFDYMKEVYGSERVARLGTVTMFKARSALQEAGASLRVPRWKCDKVADSLIERSSADARASDTLEDTLRGTPAGKEVLEGWPEILVAAKMEGHPRHYSQHAAGVVVAEQPIEEIVAVDHRTGATMCDKKDAEGRLNLLKIDALGLTQLSVIEDALRMAGMTMEELQRVPLDDAASFEILNKGHFSGIFQWNGGAVQSLTKQFRVDRFDDIVAISALARPGPLASGASLSWIKRRTGDAAPTAIHPMLEEITRETHGVIVYQEQVMKVAREMGRLSWEDTSELRKAMSGSKGDEFFQQYRKKFIDGAIEGGVDEEKAGEIWDQINTFGSWAFNKSHAVAYGYVSYWCCWLKAHFPFEFAAATLTHETQSNRQIDILREMAGEGYAYVPVDAEHSIDKWTTARRKGVPTLIGPLQNVHGIGPKMVQQIIGARSRGEELPSRAAKLLEKATTDIDSLFPIRDAIDRLMPDPLERNITSRPTKVADLRGGMTDVLVFALLTKINPRDENEDIKIVERGYRMEDPRTAYLILRIADDTGEMTAKVNRFNFDRVAPAIIHRGRVSKSIWALKGKVIDVSEDFTMMTINMARYIGDMDEAKRLRLEEEK